MCQKKNKTKECAAKYQKKKKKIASYEKETKLANFVLKRMNIDNNH